MINVEGDDREVIMDEIYCTMSYAFPKENCNIRERVL